MKKGKLLKSLRETNRVAKELVKVLVKLVRLAKLLYDLYQIVAHH